MVEYNTEHFYYINVHEMSPLHLGEDILHKGANMKTVTKNHLQNESPLNSTHY